MKPVKIKIDTDTGELLPIDLMIPADKAPAIIIDINDVKIYHNDPDKIVDKIRNQAGFAVFDVSTEKGRAACRSHAANIIKCIAPALNASKALASEAKKVVNQDLNFRNYFESAVREIAAYHRRPLNEYENEQERIKEELLAKEAKRLADEKYLVDWDDAIDLDELYMLRKAKEEMEKKAAEDKRIADEKIAFEKAVAERVEQDRIKAENREIEQIRLKKIVNDTEKLYGPLINPNVIYDSLPIVEFRPTRLEIIKVIADNFNTTEEKAVYWLCVEFGD